MVRNLVLIFILTLFHSVNADELKFALVPKIMTHPFFLESLKGCQDAAIKIGGVKCIFRGSPEAFDVREQNKILEQLIVDEGVDGIAVAIVQSEYLAKNSLQKAKEAGIPVITFDSDLDFITLKNDPNLRLAYIGTDNFEFGKALGKEIKKRRPNGDKLCIQMGYKNSFNLNLRLMGVRTVLSGKIYNVPPGEKLKNINGWTEIARCPLYSLTQIDRAIEQMNFILSRPQQEVDTFVSVLVGVQQIAPEKYRQLISPVKEKIAQKEIVIISADTTEAQLALLKEHLSDINIGQMPYEMGRQAIFTLYKIVTGKEYQEIIYTPLTYCTPENYDTCTKSGKLNHRN
ncbi:MAG: sugar ABC transporter substrate-binding protein [Thioploca sp.]|nr:sugar ABC transporter substrate-binding protein [Thioploca sp.]